MRIKSFLALSVVGLLIAIALMSFGYADNWRKLGERRVDYKLDHDVINVSIRDGRFQQLKFVVTGGALNMHRCVVHFENGGVQEIELRHNFDRRSASRTIDLKGNERFIEKISFWYDTKNFAGRKAHLSVFGK
jgi:Protein of unknown function (DUF2541)